MGIPAEYREWLWLLIPLRMEKYGPSSKEEIKLINEDVYACLITIVEFTVNKSGRKRYSPSASESSIEKKSMISSIFRGGYATLEKLVINMSSIKEKMDAYNFEES